MKKSNKQVAIIVSIAVVVIAAIVIAYFVLRKKGNTLSLSSLIIPEETTVTTLQYGSRGEEVKRLQTYLNQELKLSIWKGLPTLNGQEIDELDVDGIFGAKTQAAVKWRFGTSSVSTNQF